VLTAVIIAATVIAVALRLYDLSRPGYLRGISEYDDGTDFGSAIRLVHGAIPYRDFIMVQPPGITLLMYPVALATKAAGTVTGMATGRVFTALASAAAVPVAGLITRHRGLFATLVTCGLLAVFPDTILAARTVLLEPWLVLFCLLGALAVFDGDQIAGNRRLFLGGLAFGFAGAVKVWAIIPVVVILALTARRPRQAARYTAGVVLGFCVPVLPFALSAPSTFYHSVIIAQLIRTDVQPIPQGYRLQQILGLTHVTPLPTPLLTIIGIVVVLAIAAVYVLAARLAHGRPPALDWFAAGTCALVAAAFLWPADFYYHYAAFLTPFLALVIALPVARLLAALPPGSTRRWLRALRPAAMVTAAVTLVVFGVLQVIAESNQYSGVPYSEISAAERLIPRGACVFTDQVSYTIAINRFVSPVPGCSLMVDGVGTDYALSNGRNGQNGAGSSPAVQAAWMSGFRTARYVWLTGQAYRRISWTPQLTAYFDSHFVRLATVNRDRLFIRAAHPEPGRLEGIPAAPPMPTTHY
jgi:hypothetical protein